MPTAPLDRDPSPSNRAGAGRAGDEASARFGSAELVAGDRAAFEQVVAEHQAAIHAFLRARLFQATDADDLAQEVFLRFYIARARFDTAQMIRPWLLGIARNLLREHARKTRRHRETAWTELCLELEELLPATEGLYDDALGYLSGCLEELGESARDALHQHYGHSRKLAEIGQRLKRREGAVKLLIFRARQALKRCLAHKLGPGG